MRFTGHERDGVETAGWADDLDYMRARYCSPRWGRFLSVDPARDSARVGVPQSWNRYSYVMNRPLTHIDPDGEEGVGIIQDLDNKALLSGEMSREEYLERAGARAQGALAGALFLVPTPEDFLIAAAVGRLLRGVGRSAGRVASSRSAVSRETTNPLAGTRYTGKVRQQMRSHPRTGVPDNHGFPLEVDNLAGQGTTRQITGRDGVVRTKVELSGSYRGKEGTFEWIIEPDGSVNHRLFVPEPSE